MSRETELESAVDQYRQRVRRYRMNLERLENQAWEQLQDILLKEVRSSYNALRIDPVVYSSQLGKAELTSDSKTTMGYSDGKS